MQAVEKKLKDVQVGDVVVKVGTARHIQLELNNPVKTKSYLDPTWIRLTLKGGAVIEGFPEDTVFVKEAALRIRKIE